MAMVCRLRIYSCHQYSYPGSLGPWKMLCLPSMCQYVYPYESDLCSTISTIMPPPPSIPFKPSTIALCMMGGFVGILLLLGFVIITIVLPIQNSRGRSGNHNNQRLRQQISSRYFPIQIVNQPQWLRDLKSDGSRTTAVGDWFSLASFREKSGRGSERSTHRSLGPVIIEGAETDDRLLPPPNMAAARSSSHGRRSSIVVSPLPSLDTQSIVPSQLCPVNVTAVVTFKDMPVSMNQDVGVLEAGAGAKALCRSPR